MHQSCTACSAWRASTVQWKVQSVHGAVRAVYGAMQDAVRSAVHDAVRSAVHDAVHNVVLTVHALCSACSTHRSTHVESGHEDEMRAGRRPGLSYTYLPGEPGAHEQRGYHEHRGDYEHRSDHEQWQDHEQRGDVAVFWSIVSEYCGDHAIFRRYCKLHVKIIHVCFFCGPSMIFCWLRYRKRKWNIVIGHECGFRELYSNTVTVDVLFSSHLSQTIMVTAINRQILIMIITLTTGIGCVGCVVKY